MNILRPLMVCGVLCCMLAVAGEPIKIPKQATLHTGDVPIGSLGFPVGSYLTIEGMRGGDGGKGGGARWLLVDTINGQKLAEPVGIWIEKTETLPKDTRCVLKGYETFEMMGDAPAYEAAAKEAGRNISAPQFAYQVHLFFVTMSVESPTRLKLEKAPNQ
jgi:hypothetical protein